MTDEWTDLHANDHGDTIDHTGRIVNDDGTEPHGPLDKHARDVDQLIAAAQALTDKIAAYGLPPEYLIDEWRALRSAIEAATGQAQP